MKIPIFKINNEIVRFREFEVFDEFQYVTFHAYGEMPVKRRIRLMGVDSKGIKHDIAFLNATVEQRNSGRLVYNIDEAIQSNLWLGIWERPKTVRSHRSYYDGVYEKKKDIT